MAALDLDNLDEGGLDALDVGIIQIDAEGIVHRYNRTESVLSGRTSVNVIGRDFFREVAPCTNVPAFRGRFVDAVRSGRVDESFSFVFGFDPTPVRVSIAIRSAREAGRYWVTVEVVEPLRRRPRGEAAAAVDARARAQPVDPTVCEREPIHIPGTIQPNNVLLAAGPDLVVTVASANSAEVFGRPPAELVGRPLADLLPDDLVWAIRHASDNDALRPETPLRRQIGIGEPPAPHLATAHVHLGRLLIEFERLPTRPEDFGSSNAADIEEAVVRLRAATGVAAAAEMAARDVRAFTRFERVLVYRFDDEWNGEAVAEDRTPAWPQSLMGLRFPASDIPAQARALYTRSRSRFVVDRDFVPVPLVASPAAGNEPVDLTFAQARSLSPIHLEYQRNLGVNGSMSASIMVEGRLWGLVIGHHRKPHYLPPETRAAVTLVAGALSSRIQEIESRALSEARQTDVTAQIRLVEQMAGADDFVDALTGGDTDLLALFEASGAAVVSGDRLATVGRTPDASGLKRIVEWLRTAQPARRTFATNHLSGELAAAEAWRNVASGLLATSIGSGRDEFLLWFRPEVVGSIVWGGDPRKSVVAAPDSTVLPRRSFERWVEERSGHAAPWAPWQEEIAEALAGAVAGVVRRESRRFAELSAKQDDLVALLADKERLLAQKDVLTREIDHRVRNSLTIVASFLQMQSRTITDPDAKRAFADTYGRVMSVARVHDSLYQSESVEEVDLGQTIQNLCNDLAGMTGEKREVAIEAKPGLMVPYRTAVGLALVASELVTNAFKYAYTTEEPGGVQVTVAPQLDGAGVCLTVADQGRGLPSDWASAKCPGSGLGMRLVRAMLDQIGGTMTVENATPQGSRFVVCT